MLIYIRGSWRAHAAAALLFGATPCGIPVAAARTYKVGSEYEYRHCTRALKCVMDDSSSERDAESGERDQRRRRLATWPSK